MSMLTRGRSRLAALGTAGALAASALVFAAPSAQAADVSSLAVGDGSLTWGLSSYLTTPAMGSITALASGYEAPAAYDVDTKLSSFHVESATVAADGAAEIAFDGAAVMYAPTGNSWLKFDDLIVDVDANGNGVMSALVAYGKGVGNYPSSSYDPTVAPLNGPVRTVLVELEDNTSAQVDAGLGESTWTGLRGTWSTELTDFLGGDSTAVPAIPALTYRSQLTNETGKAPLPIDITVDWVPSTSVAVTGFTKDYLDLSISGTGFGVASETRPGANGVYIGVAESGGILDVDAEGQEDGVALFAASGHVEKNSIVDGAFTRALAVETTKLTKGGAYSLYTWSAHGNPVAGDSQMTETPLTIDWNALTPPVVVPPVTPPAPAKVAPKLTLKVTKAPTTRKAGRAVLTVKGSKGAATGKVKVQVLKGKKVVKNLGAKSLKKGKLTVALPKRPKGTYKVKVTYVGNTSYQAASTAKAFKVRKR